MAGLVDPHRGIDTNKKVVYSRVSRTAFINKECDVAIAHIVQAPGVTQEQYDQLTGELESRGYGAPDGRVYHVAFPSDEGWTVFNVWESEEKLQSFAAVIMPIFADAGVKPQQKIYPIHNIVKG